MAASLQININADDWLDVTSKEELLQTEVSRLSEVLDTRGKELEVLAEKVIQLETEKSVLETGRELLGAELRETKDALEEIVSGKEAVEERLEFVGASLTASNKEISKARDSTLRLECQIKDLKCQHDKESKESQRTIDSLNKTVAQLELRLSLAESTNKTQKEQLCDSRAQLKEYRAEVVALKGELAKKGKEAASSAKKLDTVNKQLGAVAILAEERKDERHDLSRTVAQKKFALTQASKELDQRNGQILTLEKELSQAKESSAARISDLEGDLRELRAKLDAIREEADKQSEIMQTKSEDLVAARVQILDLEAELKEYKKQVSALKDDLADSHVSEESLRGDMAAQKAEFEQQKEKYEERLANIRDALGIKKCSQKQQTSSPTLDIKFGLPIKFNFP